MAKIKYILLAMLLPVVANATLILDPPGTTVVNNTFSPINNITNENTFSPINNITNANTFTPTFSPTNVVNIGATTIVNSNVFFTSVTNLVQGGDTLNFNSDVSQSFTNIYNEPTTFVTQNHTNTPTSVRIYSGTNLATSVVAGANMDIYLAGGGGGGDVSINGVTTNSFSFVGQFPVSVSNIGSTFYFGQLGGGGTFIPAGDSNQVFNFVGSVTQTFTVPSGVTQLYAYAWGAGGGGGSTAGGAGGYSFGYFMVTNSEILTVIIGQGGFVSSTTTSSSVFTNTANPYPNGGRGISRSTVRAGAGGGSTAVLRGTNYLIIAGGGGGSGAAISSGAGGGGGGDSGQAGFGGGTLGGAGGGGTQLSGGSTPSSTNILAYTNTAGSYYLGGDAGTHSNANANSSGGGGGGLYGGGGGLIGTAANAGGGGGGGSGYINSSQGLIGFTVRAQTPASSFTGAPPPPGVDDPLYGFPTALTWGYGGLPNNAGQNGAVIFRWVQP